MRKQSRALVFGVVLLLLVALATAAAADESPWKASYTGTFEPATHMCSDTDAVPIYTVGYGNATHLGEMTIETWDCVNFNNGAITEGTVVFTAANGDELHGTFEGGVTGPPDPDGWVPFTIVSDYDEGTGRFTHATGQAVELGRVFLSSPPSNPAGLIEGRLTGTVAYDASDRAR